MAEREKISRHIHPQHSHQDLHQVRERVRKAEQLAGMLDPIPVGYIGPGFLRTDDGDIRVNIHTYYGVDDKVDPEADKNDHVEIHHYGASLSSLGTRFEGRLRGDIFYATPTDIQVFKEKTTGATKSK